MLHTPPQSLELTCHAAEPPISSQDDPLAGLAQLLPTLQLRSLILQLRVPSQAAIAAICHLSALTELDLRWRDGAPCLRQLTRLQRLRQLYIGTRQTAEWDELAAPGNFPAIEFWGYSTNQLTVRPPLVRPPLVLSLALGLASHPVGATLLLWLAQASGRAAQCLDSLLSPLLSAAAGRPQAAGPDARMQGACHQTAPPRPR